MYKEIRYFKGLNALRFFAAYFVVLHHAEQIRWKNDLFNLKEFSIFNNGGIAVTFFFVLSGFLISYLLQKELKQTNRIAINDFYLRRILRIWPLYFLLVIIGTLLIPLFLSLINYSYEMPYEFKDVLLYYVFFSPFMVNILYGHHLLEPLWSIGVEELFYIFFAPLYKCFEKYILAIILTIIFVKVIILLIIPSLQLSPVIIQIVNMLQFEAMAIGVLASYLLYNRNTALESSFIFSKLFQILLLSFITIRIVGFQYFTGAFFLFDYLYTTPIISNLLLMVAFALLIVNISVNKQSIINLDTKVFNFLGEISYGIYMYHMLVIFGIILLFKQQLSGLTGIFASILFYTILTAGVLFISYLSKKLFEDYFLKLKCKFRVSQPIPKAKPMRQVEPILNLVKPKSINSHVEVLETVEG